MTEPAVRIRLARLAREVDVDRVALAARAEEAAALRAAWSAREGLPRPELVLLAVNLHGYYTGLEMLFERVARLLDEAVPDGATWHADLIDQMQVDVPGLRPALVPSDVATELHQLRRFRHFFRNAYVLELDPAQVRDNADRLARLHPRLAGALDALRAHVDALAAHATP